MPERNKRSNRDRAIRTEEISASLSAWPTIGIVVLLCAAVWIAYGPALDNDFVEWDDHTYVTQRPEVTHPSREYLTKFWSMPVAMNYHPLTMMSLAWNGAMFGPRQHDKPMKAYGFIATNVGLHMLNTCLVFLFIVSLSQGRTLPAALTAAIFGLHPMHVESVAWVSARKDVMHAFFILLSLLSYLRWLRSNGAGWLVACCSLFILACLSKAMAVVLPLVLLMLDHHEHRSLARLRPWLEKLPLFGISMLFGAMALDIQGGGDFHGWLSTERGPGQIVAPDGLRDASALDRLQNASFGFTMYLFRFIWPSGHSALHPYEAISQYPLVHAIGPWVMLSFVVAMARSFKRRRELFFASGFFLVWLALVLQFLPIGRAIMAERYTYLPYIGLAYALAIGLEHAIRKWMLPRFTGPAIVLSASMVMIPLVRSQADAWQNTGSLFEQVIARYPSSAEAYTIMGSWYGKHAADDMDRGPGDAASIIFQDALREGAASAALFDALGTSHTLAGRPDSGLYYYNKAIGLGPVTGLMLHNRATAKQYSDPEGAIADLSRSIELGHDKVSSSFVFRASLNYSGGRYQPAYDDLNVAIGKHRINDAQVYVLRGVCAYQLGRTSEARADAQRALELDPNSTEATNLLQATGR